MVEKNKRTGVVVWNDTSKVTDWKDSITFWAGEDNPNIQLPGDIQSQILFSFVLTSSSTDTDNKNWKWGTLKERMG